MVESVSFTSPGQASEPLVNQEAIERRLKLAEQLRLQSITPMGQSASIPGGLAKLLEAYTSKKQRLTAEGEEAALRELETTEAAELIRRHSDPYKQEKAAAMEEKLRQQQGGVPELMQSQFREAPFQTQKVQDIQLKMLINQLKGPDGQHKDISRHEYYQGLDQPGQESFLSVQRANPYIDLGDVKTRFSQTTPGMPLDVQNVGFKPAQTTEYKQELEDISTAGAADVRQNIISTAAELEAEKKTGAGIGATRVSVADMNARLPRLEDVVAKLSALGKKATYTLTGQARDSFRRQTDQPVGEGAVARAEYIATVANEMLPLLKPTFGAAFTVDEGESLKATLGDPNASPEEKEAMLRSFIDAKIENIKSEERKLEELGGVSPVAMPSGEFDNLSEEDLLRF